jgi:hypothetical protein
VPKFIVKVCGPRGSLVDQFVFVAMAASGVVVAMAIGPVYSVDVALGTVPSRV